MDLRKEAKGRPCMIRLPGCDGGGETTVLAHYRMSGYCGTGIKPDDLAFGSWACNHCHGLIDGRIRYKGMIAVDELRMAHAEGVMRTIAQLRKEGKA